MGTGEWIRLIWSLQLGWQKMRVKKGSLINAEVPLFEKLRLKMA
jgi:hypothetical protein